MLALLSSPRVFILFRGSVMRVQFFPHCFLILVKTLDLGEVIRTLDLELGIEPLDSRKYMFVIRGLILLGLCLI